MEEAKRNFMKDPINFQKTNRQQHYKLSKDLADISFWISAAVSEKESEYKIVGATK